jgi:hypothetical protein
MFMKLSQIHEKLQWQDKDVAKVAIKRKTINEGRTTTTARWHETDVILTPYLSQKLPEFEDPLDNTRDEFGGYDIEYKVTVVGIPEEPQTLEYPGFPAHIEIDNVTVMKITKADREVLRSDKSHPHDKQFIDAAEEYFWDHVADNGHFQEGMAEAFEEPDRY